MIRPQSLKTGLLDLVGVLRPIWPISGGRLGPAGLFRGDCSGGDLELGVTTWEEGAGGMS